MGVAIGKFNGHAHLDIAVANKSGNSVMLFTGYGDGTFTPAHVYPTVSSPQALVAADLDGNGGVDFASLSSGGSDNSVSVALGTLQDSASNFLPSVTVDSAGIASHSLECSYSGDPNYGASTSSPMAVGFLTAAPPQFSLLVGDYPAAQPVEITDSSSNAVIYYTSDGSDPTTSSTVYNGPITITSSVKLKAIAAGPYLASAISEAVYTIAAAPQFSVVSKEALNIPGAAAEVSTIAQTVTITDNTPGAVVYYTTDGTAPSTKSARYAAPFTIIKTTTVKAFAKAPGYINSSISTQTDVIDLPKPAITWATPAEITYGEKLGADELDARTSVAGTFTYSPKLGTILAAGTHTLSVTFTPSNLDAYVATTKSVQIEVRKKALEVAASHLTKVYGAAMPRLTYSISGFVDGDTGARAVTGEPLLATNAKEETHVGIYSITVTDGTLKSANYSFDFSNGELTITRAELKVTARNQTMKQGATLPELTYAITGFVNKDTQSSATTGKPILTTTATSKSKPGSYPIDVRAGTLAAKNYRFTYFDGQVTVVP